MIDDFVRYEYAQRLFDERKYAAAARELEGILASAGDVPTGLGEARLLLVRAYYHSAQLGRAQEHARQLVDADPTDAYAMLLLARSLERQGRWEDAAPWRRRADALGLDA